MEKNYETLQELLESPRNRRKITYCVFREPFRGKIPEEIVRREYVKFLEDIKNPGLMSDLMYWKHHQQVLRDYYKKIPDSEITEPTLELDQNQINIKELQIV